MYFDFLDLSRNLLDFHLEFDLIVFPLVSIEDLVVQMVQPLSIHLEKNEGQLSL